MTYGTVLTGSAWMCTRKNTRTQISKMIPAIARSRFGSSTLSICHLWDGARFRLPFFKHADQLVRWTRPQSDRDARGHCAEDRLDRILVEQREKVEPKRE